MRDLILAHAPREAMHARLADISLPNVECFFFGCIDGPGHFFNAPRRTWRAADAVGRAVSTALGGLDGCLCWNSATRYDRDETEGRAFRTYRGGYTAVAFWDRSVDRRGACNSAFIVYGELTFAQIVRAARHAWPNIWARFTFPVVEVDAQGREVAR